MQFTYENEAGEEIAVTFPTTKCICSDCRGEGSVLREGMRGHAYTAEEFYESFDEEQAEEYFKRGGRYDVVCPTCNGKNVVDELDESQCNTPELKAALAAYHESCRLEAMDRCDAAFELKYCC